MSDAYLRSPMLMIVSRYRISAWAIAALLSLGAGDAVRAQPAHPPSTAAAAPDASVAGSELTVYLMTMGPGDAVWEKFGHNAIWIHDRARNTDVAYNWGLFDFAASDFLPRFLKGNMRYWMGGFDQQATLDFYRQSNRSVWAQELNLTPAQRTSLARFVEWNALPENRFYDYDYYRDNCSTRVRDVLDRGLGGAMKRQLDSAMSGLTYRYETQRLTEDDKLIYAGTMLGLGHPVDRRLSGWELGFLPGRLREIIRDVDVPDSSGKLVPLVKAEDTLFVATRPPEPVGARGELLGFLWAGGVLFSAMMALAQWAKTLGGWRRGALLLTAAAWSLIAGIAGTALVALWTLTNHVYSYRNENLLQATPLSLVLAVMLLLEMRRPTEADRLSLVGARTMQLAWVIVLLSALGLAMKILPIFRQENWDIIALMLLAHLGVALALGGGSIVPARFRRWQTPAMAG